ncbi:MAG: hypothetical protein Q7V19_05765, partial [Bacteroidales bacterium]|nr:hypothetical protein [Bacteroidales bacterium]
MIPENDLGGQFERLKAQNLERLKELAILNRTSHIIRENRSPDETLKYIAMVLPAGWQYPAFTGARIMYDGTYYLSSNFELTPWHQKQDFSTFDGNTGFVEICYTKEYPVMDEGPFLEEERDLLLNLTNMISGYLNTYKGLTIIEKSTDDKERKTTISKDEEQVHSRKLLQLFLNKNNADRDIYHDLMNFKVKEILLISNLYDAYSIEREGRF